MVGKLVFVAVCTLMPMRIAGNTFLKMNTEHAAERVSEQDIKTSLLEEIEGSLGTGIAARRIKDMEATLRPMFHALPQNQHGNLDHVTVRYALHRVFVQRHGWSIKGLNAAGQAWNSSSAAGILKDQVPSFIQDLFEQRLGGRGLGLHDLAVFAATLEQLIHKEAVGQLGSALNLHGLLPTALLSSSQADEVLDTYMMAYILGKNLAKMKMQTVSRLKGLMPQVFLAWRDTQEFVRSMRANMTSSFAVTSSPGEEQQLSFASLVKVAETVGEKFGKFQDVECKQLKTTLVNIEDRGSGRVRLSDFYKPALDGSWQFQESLGYLRELGALDESNPDDTRVMITNYLTSQTNCIASSDYYSVCCIDECEDLLGHVEKDVAAPEASAQRILDLISKLPSSSLAAPRELSATLRGRLEEIAAGHGGSVQLHSRLFAQWMHHAYPRECPYPHVSGTTSQMKAQEWAEINGAATASEEDIVQYVAMSNSTGTNTVESEDVNDLMMWSHEEELLVVRANPAPVPSFGLFSPAGAARKIIAFAALSSIAVGLVRTTLSASSKNDEVPQKFLV